MDFPTWWAPTSRQFAGSRSMTLAMSDPRPLLPRGPHDHLSLRGEAVQHVLGGPAGVRQAQVEGLQVEREVVTQVHAPLRNTLPVRPLAWATQTIRQHPAPFLRIT